MKIGKRRFLTKKLDDLSVKICLILVLLMVAAGCSGKFSNEEFVREDVDFSIINRVAVLPFKNNTKDEYAHEQARNITITQLLSLGIADVVDRAVVDSVMTEEAIDSNQPVDLLNIKRLGQRLNVQAFLLGSVDMTGVKSVGSLRYPNMAMTLRLVDSQSSTIIWQSTGHWTAETVTGRVFGISPTDKFHVNLKLVNKMLRSLER